MKTITKIFVGIGLAGVLAVAGFMTVVSVLHTRSRHEIARLVSEISPGTAFGPVAARLGREAQTLTNAADIRLHGTAQGAHLSTTTTLHLFVHEATPWRWICIYTDRTSQTVVYADWRDM